MATNENQFRSELAKTLRSKDWQVVVTSAEFNIGLPDLYAKSPSEDLPGVWIELKWLKTPPKLMTNQIDLTVLQRNWLMEHRKRGGYAYYGVGYPNTGGRNWTMGLGYKNLSLENKPTLNDLSFFTKRAAGEEWGIEKIIAAITQED